MIQILYMTPEFAIKAYLEGMLNLNQMVPARAFVQKTQLLEVSYFSPNVYLGKRIVNEANRIFLEDSIESNTEEAKQSLSLFRYASLIRVKDELEISEQSSTPSKKKNTSVDINLEVSIPDTATTKKFLSRLNLQNQDMRSLQHYTNLAIHCYIFKI